MIPEVSLKKLTAAAILLFSMLGAPPLIASVCKDTGLTGIMMLSNLIGLAAFKFISPQECGLKKLSSADLWSAVKIGLIILPASGLVTWLWEMLLDFYNIDHAGEQNIAILIKNYSDWRIAQIFFSICIAAPIFEEVLFRKLLFSSLEKFSRTAAWIITPLAFGTIHFFLLGLPGLIVLGIGFQIVFAKSRNLSAAAVTHALVNAAAFCVIFIENNH